jgi:hypothetical protein
VRASVRVMGHSETSGARGRRGIRADVEDLQEPDRSDERRYSPAVCTGVEMHVPSAAADPDKISTSDVERRVLTMRMRMRCFTRLTNAFSKKVEDLTHVVTLHCMHYNCCRSDQSLGQKTTPALPAG